MTHKVCIITHLMRMMITEDIANMILIQNSKTRVGFLFQVLLGIGALFRVGSPYSIVPLSVTIYISI